MSQRTKPPFRAEHIGSLLRPRELTHAFRAHNAGELDDDAFHAIQDQAIRDVVAFQEGLGLQMVTDGEFRRGSYWGHWIPAIDGLEVAEAQFTFHDESGEEQVFIAPTCTGKLKKVGPISTEEFKFLKTVATSEPKITMPSPSTLHFWRGPAGLEGSPYGSAEAFFADLCAIYRQEIRELHEAGCRYVQLDEVPLIMLADPDVKAKLRERGEDPDALTGTYIAAMNDAVRDRPEGMTAAMHVCRGNFKGKWLTEGGYEEMAERAFQEIDVDAFCLEYDTPRAGDFKPLAKVPADKMVVLGLVSSKVPDIEDAAALTARIDEAAQYIDRERLAISPQCGFASAVSGNPVTFEDEKAKLGLCVDVARRAWG